MLSVELYHEHHANQSRHFGDDGLPSFIHPASIVEITAILETMAGIRLQWLSLRVPWLANSVPNDDSLVRSQCQCIVLSQANNGEPSIKNEISWICTIKTHYKIKFSKFQDTSHDERLRDNLANQIIDKYILFKLTVKRTIHLIQYISVCFDSISWGYIILIGKLMSIIHLYLA